MKRWTNEEIVGWRGGKGETYLELRIECEETYLQGGYRCPFLYSQSPQH